MRAKCVRTADTSTNHASPTGYLRVEHGFVMFGEGCISSRPVFASDSKPLLRELFKALSSRQLKEWVVEGRIDPLVVKEIAYLDKPAGDALRMLVQKLTGARWAWQRDPRSATEHLEIPVDAVWKSEYPETPIAFEESALAVWNRKGGFGLCNDMFILLDLSGVSGVDSASAQRLVPQLISTVLADPAIWNVVASWEGYFRIRVRGRAAVWLSEHRSTAATWRKLRYANYIAEVTARAGAAEPAKRES